MLYYRRKNKQCAVVHFEISVTRNKTLKTIESHIKIPPNQYWRINTIILYFVSTQKDKRFLKFIVNITVLVKLKFFIKLFLGDSCGNLHFL